MKLFPPESIGGARILSYTLEIDGGDINTVFTNVTAYSGNVFTHTFKVSDGIITRGKIYGIRFKANNFMGPSEYSEIL